MVYERVEVPPTQVVNGTAAQEEVNDDQPIIAEEAPEVPAQVVTEECNREEAEGQNLVYEEVTKPEHEVD